MQVSLLSLLTKEIGETQLICSRSSRREGEKFRANFRSPLQRRRSMLRLKKPSLYPKIPGNGWATNGQRACCYLVVGLLFGGRWPSGFNPRYARTQREWRFDRQISLVGLVRVSGQADNGAPNRPLHQRRRGSIVRPSNLLPLRLRFLLRNSRGIVCHWAPLDKVTVLRRISFAFYHFRGRCQIEGLWKSLFALMCPSSRKRFESTDLWIVPCWFLGIELTRFVVC